MRISTLIFTFVLVFALSVSVFGDKIIVDIEGGGDYTSIQDAIDSSTDGDVVEVWPGIYHEHINFYGQKITVTGKDPNDINIIYSTVIDGDMSGNVVVFDSVEDGSSVLRGLTLTNGYNGVSCYYSSPFIDKCVIQNNDAGISGYNSNAAVSGCIIMENHGTAIENCHGGIRNCQITQNGGTGISECSGPIEDCLIKGNGQGIYLCSGEIVNCVIEENDYYGIYYFEGKIRNCVVRMNDQSGLSNCQNCEVSNCVISGNLGSGLEGFYGEIKNCTIVGNMGDGVNCDWSNVIVCSENIIIKNGGFGIVGDSDSTIQYNNIWGNSLGSYWNVIPGATDLHVNPLFAVDGYWESEELWIDGDYHLKSEAGRWTVTGWVNDNVTSLCVDAGDPASDYALETEPDGGRINMGAYGNTEFASKSPYEPEFICTEYPTADVNRDCKVDFIDMAIMASQWLQCNLEDTLAD